MTTPRWGWLLGVMILESGRGKGTSLNSTCLTPKPFASSVYVHVPEAPSPGKRAISVMSLFPSPGGRPRPRRSARPASERMGPHHPQEPVGGQPPPAAAPEQDPIILRVWRRTGAKQLGVDRFGPGCHHRPPPTWTKGGAAGTGLAPRRRP